MRPPRWVRVASVVATVWVTAAAVLDAVAGDVCGVVANAVLAGFCG